MRIPLSQGAVVQGDHDYVIDSMIGEGANCIVYEAHFYDSKHNCKHIRLKECYPVLANLGRADTAVCWHNPDQKADVLQKFEKSYQISSWLQNQTAMGTTSIYSTNIFDCNQTKYMVIIPDHGVSYDQISAESLDSTIKTALALTKAIEVYHSNGYLHLDIKPSNFIVSDDTTGDGKNIVLFDVDTIVSMKDLRNHKVGAITYSKGWAAPEQTQNKLAKLCPATDLYAIGVVLFEKIMQRSVTSEDRCTMMEWDWEERFQDEHINPAVFRYLSDIFHNTLAANVNRRYKSARELTKALKKVLKVLNSEKPFLVSHLPATCPACIGREEELSEVADALKTQNATFIYGPGGIGKSTLAMAYAKAHRRDYDAIVFLRYSATTSIEALLERIPICNIIDDEDRYEVLQRICNPRVLLILDNLDISPEDEPGLDSFLELNCHKIITTRTDFCDFCEDIPAIKLLGLSFTDLHKIFNLEADCYLSKHEFGDLFDVLEQGAECTLIWTLLDSLIKTGAYAVEEL